MRCWPTPPAELRSAVVMLHAMHGPADVIDEQLAIAVLLAPDHAVAPLVAMRRCGWPDYPGVVRLVPAIATELHALLDDFHRAAWWEQAS
jgi:hypothetical protein